ANQISAELKNELRQKLEEFSNLADTLEETFENREQIEISRYYEKLPKPTLLAINEFEEGQITYKKIES
ncbi:MAG: RNA polymerase Rpb6, partial [Bacteroidales bacterium]|nr:RNA polymerase Rpb6 [Bacteroidales bacterium]